MMLTGECNLCGACCFTKYGAVCENLEILTRQGLPNATGCRVYAERYNGMANPVEALVDSSQSAKQ